MDPLGNSLHSPLLAGAGAKPPFGATDSESVMVAFSSVVAVASVNLGTCFVDHGVAARGELL